MTAPAFCTITGRITDRAGTALPNQLVRVRFSGPWQWGGGVFGNAAIEGTAETLWTDAYGVWTTSLPQGSTAQIDIPVAGVRHFGTVPPQASIAFEDLFVLMSGVPG